MQLCECEATAQNTGTDACKFLMRDSEMLIGVPKYGSDGTLNVIDTSDTLDQDYFDDKINAADPSDRWYPLPRHKNGNSERAESDYQEYEDGTKDFVAQGIRGKQIFIPNQEFAFLGKLEAFSCMDFGFFIVDKNRTMWGMGDVAGQLRPVWVRSNSFEANYKFPKPKEVPGINVKFDFEIDEQDKYLRGIKYTEIAPVNVLNLEGLLDVNPTYSSIGQTTFKAKLELVYGTALEKRPVKGLVAADFALYNLTDSAAVSIVSCTESPDGTYTFTYSSQTVSDVLRLTPTKNGYDFSAVVASHITIP